MSRLKILGAALNSLTHIKELNTVYMSLNRDELERFNYKKGDSEGFVNFCLSIKNINNAVFLILSSPTVSIEQTYLVFIGPTLFR